MDARANCESLQSALGVSVVGKDNPWDVEKPMGIEASRLARSPGGVPTHGPKSALSASTYRRMPMPHRATLPVRSKRGTVPRTTSGSFSALASRYSTGAPLYWSTPIYSLDCLKFSGLKTRTFLPPGSSPLDPVVGPVVCYVNHLACQILNLKMFAGGEVWSRPRVKFLPDDGGMIARRIGRWGRGCIVPISSCPSCAREA